MSHKIGITACSNPMHPSFSADLARLCQILRELGFDPVLSPCLYDNGSSTVDQLRLRIHHRENMSGERETKQENQKPGAEA